MATILSGRLVLTVLTLPLLPHLDAEERLLRAGAGEDAREAVAADERLLLHLGAAESPRRKHTEDS